MKIVGIDFTSAPHRKKPIVVAVCEFAGNRLILRHFIEFCDWPAYELWLGHDDQWIGGFDFPFGLPRRFVEAQGWPLDWPSMVKKCVSGGKENFVRVAMAAFQAAKEKQDKHRATDMEAHSESPLKTMANPPVGRMFYEGSWRLLSSNLHVPALNENGARKIALEAYPGLLISRLGERYYKNDKPRTEKVNTAARKRIVSALREGDSRLVPEKLELETKALELNFLDPSGDWLDAVLCALQATWAWKRRDQRFGLPAHIESCEGWIVSAGIPARPRV